MLLSTAVYFGLVALATAGESSELEARQRKEDLSFCFGDGSYCGSALDLNDECRDLQNNFDDQNPWYECICANGYLSTKIACNWCQAAYNLSYTVGLTEDQTETCQSLSYSIAPIPATIQALQSSFNATYTGIVPGANESPEATTTGTSVPSETSKSDASVTSGGAAVTTTSTPRIGISATRSTFLSTVTFNGGAAGAGATRSSTTGAEQQTATSTPSATPTGAAEGGRNGFAIGFSVLVSAILGLVMV
ncbi:hypothetical protein DL98DRAFT_636649 [Cadophora sp. DSE1049]|nr:hypothetical protein DL98DRAFT_636649 [Cadophora sp. DSE1049]